MPRTISNQNTIPFEPRSVPRPSLDMERVEAQRMRPQQLTRGKAPTKPSQVAEETERSMLNGVDVLMGVHKGCRVKMPEVKHSTRFPEV